MIKLQFKDTYDSTSNKKKLDSLIKEYIELVDDFGKINGLENINNSDSLIEIILFELNKKTNLQKILDDLKIYSVRGILRKILSTFKKNHPSSESYFKFIFDDFNNFISGSEKFQFKCFIPLYLQLEISDDNFIKFNNYLNSLFKYKLIKKIDEKYLNLLEDSYYKAILTKNLCVEFDFYATDYRYINKVLKEDFVGILLFSKNFHRIIMKFNLENDSSISENYIEQNILIVKNGCDLVYPPYREYNSYFEKKFKSKSLGLIINNENIELIFNILDKINCQKKLKKTFEKIFDLYYMACVEKNLEVSFLKFWIISETLLNFDGSNDKTFLKRMKKIISGSNKKIIEDLYAKRNMLVHEFEVQIEDYDRNLAKSISESIIYFILSCPILINDLSELVFILDQYNASNSNLERKKEIINEVLKNKTQ